MQEVALIKDPESDDLLLPIPEDFAASEDWLVGDEVRLTNSAAGTIEVENLSSLSRSQSV